MMDKRNGRLQVILLSILMLVNVAIHLFIQKEEWVELYYSSVFYPPFGNLLRFVFSIFRGSVGDVLYTLFIGYFIWRIIHFFRKMASASSKKGLLWVGLLQASLILLSLITWFQLCWGINYHRKGISYQLAMGNEKYTSANLIQLDAMLLDSMNVSKTLTLLNKDFPAGQDVFLFSEEACNQATYQYPFLAYKQPSIKRSYYGWLGNYLGFTGYYNPFTGEAQVNTTIPIFLQPFVTCHEIAHQLGYARENEANFVGYLIATQSPKPFVKYSAYLEMYLYTNRYLYSIDSMAATRSRQKIHPGVKSDIEEWRRFNQSHTHFMEPLFTSVYDFFLKQNKQPKGIWSYDEVVGLLVRFLKKNGNI